MKFYIKTYGCQMNERDSEAAAAILLEQGYEQTTQENDADLLIFNTCSVREQAETKAIGKIGLMKRLKRHKPSLLIGVMGCMAQRLGEELWESLPHIDFIIGTDQLHRLPNVVEQELCNRHRELLLDADPSVLTSLKAHLKPEEKVSAFVAIMRGCDRFCSYCIVPHVRGREKSREQNDILAECHDLVAKGVREIYLLGQNVAAYALDGIKPPIRADISPFAELLQAIHAIPGVARIRFTSPHPAYFNQALIQTIGTLPKVCENIHLPLQSGSNAILAAMNRPYTAEDYLHIVRELRRYRPDTTFSTDIIVGFPGETADDFEQTRHVFREVRFHNAYIFKYSPRRGTSAAGLEDDIPQAVKEERNQQLLKELGRSASEENQRWVGREIEILVEGPSLRNPLRWHGRSSQNQVVIFESTSTLKRGDLITLPITWATKASLFSGCEDLIHEEPSQEQL